MAVQEGVRIDDRKRAAGDDSADRWLEPISGSLIALENAVRASALEEEKKEAFLRRLKSTRKNLGDILARDKRELEAVLSDLVSSLATGNIPKLVSGIREKVQAASGLRNHDDQRTGFMPQSITRLTPEVLEWFRLNHFGPPKRPPLRSPPGVEPTPYLLGEGGCGIAVLVHDENLGIDVVVKLIKTADTQLLERVQREAAAMAKADQHTEAVVRVYHVEQKGQPYIKMEYVSGPAEAMSGSKTIPDELRKEFQGKAVDGEGVMIATKYLRKHLGDQFPLNLWIEFLEFIFFKAVETLGLLQKEPLGIFHRDVKPSNILIMPEVADSLARCINAAFDDPVRAKAIFTEELALIKAVETPIKICDFGLARTLSKQGTDLASASASGEDVHGGAELLTDTGDILGTVGFISSRGICDSKNHDGDHFGLGAAILAMIEGKIVLLQDSARLKENPYEYLRFQLQAAKDADAGKEWAPHSLLEKAPSARDILAGDKAFHAFLASMTKLTNVERSQEEMRKLWDDVVVWGEKRFPSPLAAKERARRSTARQRNFAIGGVVLAVGLGSGGIIKVVQQRNAEAKAAQAQAFQDELERASKIPHPAERVRALTRLLRDERGKNNQKVALLYREAVVQKMIAMSNDTRELVSRISAADRTELQLAWNILGVLLQDLGRLQPPLPSQYEKITAFQEAIGYELVRRKVTGH